jgi:hypothetical protein
MASYVAGDGESGKPAGHAFGAIAPAATPVEAAPVSNTGRPSYPQIRFQATSVSPVCRALTQIEGN